MAKITVETELKTGGFKAGLDKLAGEADRFSKLAENKFSLFDIGKRLLRGFVGIELADVLEKPFERANEQLEKMVQKTAELNTLMQQGKISREDTVGHLSDITRQIEEAKADREAAEKARDEILPDNFDRFMNTIMTGIPLLGKLSGANAREQEFNKQQEAADAAGKREQQFREEARTLQQANRLEHLDFLNSSNEISDEEKVKKGLLSGTDLARKAKGRAELHLQDILGERGDGPEANQARLGVQRAGLALFEAQARAAKESEGARPQISASSLAQVGGGGSVNVFGGSGAMLGEARTQTGILRRIEMSLYHRTGVAAGDITTK